MIEFSRGDMMSITTKEQILKVLTAFNPWWKTRSVDQVFTKTYHRFAYHEALERLNQKTLRRLVVLTGARRVGKTTIQYQIIEHLLAQGVKPQQIVFISMDHPMLKLSDFDMILESYHENIYPNKDAYYFFDEVQYMTDWDKWLKTIYDTQPNIKVIATGSASPLLMKGSRESGAGRWSVIQVPTMSFYEYCTLCDIDNIELDENIRPTAFLSMPKEKQTEVMTQLSSLYSHFNRYLQVGGFPELALADNDILAQQIMREDVVDKVLKRDLPSLYNIRNSTALERIFLYLCNVSSNIVSLDAIAKELTDVSRTTVENYIRYLESANLIYISRPIEMAGKKVLKSRWKIYIADAAIRNAVLMDDTVLSNPTIMGQIVETAVYKHIVAFYYQKATRVGYFREVQKNKEIDIVVDYPRINNILIEVKYREQSEIPKDDAIYKLCNDSAASFVITKRMNDYGVKEGKDGGKLIYLPAYAFLYLLGHAERSGYKGAD